MLGWMVQLTSRQTGPRAAQMVSRKTLVEMAEAALAVQAALAAPGLAEPPLQAGQ
jgi:hypothetical protein